MLASNIVLSLHRLFQLPLSATTKMNFQIEMQEYKLAYKVKAKIKSDRPF